MQRFISTATALVLAPLLIIPLLIVAIAAGPVIVAILFMIGTGGLVFVIGNAIGAAGLAVAGIVRHFHPAPHHSGTPVGLA